MGSSITLTITFCPPERRDGTGETSHERCLDAVPRRKAEQMRQDFRRYQSTGARELKNKLYQYTKNGRKVMVALDFGEVVALTAAGEDEGLFASEEKQGAC